MKPADDSPDGPDLRPEIPAGLINPLIKRRALYISEHDLGIITALMAVGVAFDKGDFLDAFKHCEVYHHFRTFYSSEEFKKLLTRLSTLNEEFGANAENESI